MSEPLTKAWAVLTDGARRTMAEALEEVRVAWATFLLEFARSLGLEALVARLARWLSDRH